MTEPTAAPQPNQSVDEILRRRAARLARVASSGRRGDIAVEVAVIAVGAESIGVPATSLREIVPIPPLASLPGLPAWMPGLVQIRGELMCVVDVARRLGIECGEEGRLLAVLETPKGPVGMLADRVLGFRAIASDELAESYMGGAEASDRFVRATTRDLVTILDIATLLAEQELVVDLSAA